MRRRQAGLGTFGSLVVIAILIAGGYYLYKNVLMAPDAPPSCKAALNSCISNCRKTSTEQPELQACQAKCQQDADACEQRR